MRFFLAFLLVALAAGAVTTAAIPAQAPSPELACGDAPGLCPSPPGPAARGDGSDTSNILSE